MIPQNEKEENMLSKQEVLDAIRAERDWIHEHIDDMKTQFTMRAEVARMIYIISMMKEEEYE